jgi:hypothetical protein
MNLLFCALLLSLLLSCSGKMESSRMVPYREFEFYHDDTWSTAFSIKFMQTDTVYIRQHFVSISNRGPEMAIKSNTSYVGCLSQQDRATLDSFIRHARFFQYDTAYEDDNLQDGSTYDFYIRTDSLSKVIHIYGDSAPPELMRFGRWITETKSRMRLVKIDSLIGFTHADDWLYPIPNVDLQKFKPPVSN